MFSYNPFISGNDNKNNNNKSLSVNPFANINNNNTSSFSNSFFGNNNYNNAFKKETNISTNPFLTTSNNTNNFQQNNDQLKNPFANMSNNNSSSNIYNPFVSSSNNNNNNNNLNFSFSNNNKTNSNPFLNNNTNISNFNSNNNSNNNIFSNLGTNVNNNGNNNMSNNNIFNNNNLQSSITNPFAINSNNNSISNNNFNTNTISNPFSTTNTNPFLNNNNNNSSPFSNNNSNLNNPFNNSNNNIFNNSNNNNNNTNPFSNISVNNNNNNNNPFNINNNNLNNSVNPFNNINSNIFNNNNNNNPFNLNNNTNQINFNSNNNNNINMFNNNYNNSAHQLNFNNTNNNIFQNNSNNSNNNISFLANNNNNFNTINFQNQNQNSSMFNNNNNNFNSNILNNNNNNTNNNNSNSQIQTKESEFLDDSKKIPLEVQLKNKFEPTDFHVIYNSILNSNRDDLRLSVIDYKTNNLLYDSIIKYNKKNDIDKIDNSNIISKILEERKKKQKNYILNKKEQLSYKDYLESIYKNKDETKEEISSKHQQKYNNKNNSIYNSISNLINSNNKNNKFKSEKLKNKSLFLDYKIPTYNNFYMKPNTEEKTSVNVLKLSKSLKGNIFEEIKESMDESLLESENSKNNSNDIKIKSNKKNIDEKLINILDSDGKKQKFESKGKNINNSGIKDVADENIKEVEFEPEILYNVIMIVKDSSDKEIYRKRVELTKATTLKIDLDLLYSETITKLKCLNIDCKYGFKYYFADSVELPQVGKINIMDYDYLTEKVYVKYLTMQIKVIDTKNITEEEAMKNKQLYCKLTKYNVLEPPLEKLNKYNLFNYRLGITIQFPYYMMIYFKEYESHDFTGINFDELEYNGFTEINFDENYNKDYSIIKKLYDVRIAIFYTGIGIQIVDKLKIIKFLMEYLYKRYNAEFITIEKYSRKILLVTKVENLFKLKNETQEMYEDFKKRMDELKNSL